jgi:DNA-binding winged helix-turn-helix (wHTH) protein
VRGNQVVALTPKAFDILLLLVRNSGHLLEKDELIRMHWPDTFVEEGTLTNNIFLLRKTLGEDPVFIG